MAINYVAPVRLMLGLLPHMVDQRFGHVVNVLTWGVQVRAPKFSAYIASKTALDVWSRIAGRELYGDNVTFTNLRMPLVRTAMSAPTDAYANAPALTAEQAAARVVRALEDRPVTSGTVAGAVAEVLNLVAPRASDALQWAISRRFPDSPAAVGAGHRREQAERSTPGG
jgi:short-subunit dehydrogenase